MRIFEMASNKGSKGKVAIISRESNTKTLDLQLLEEELLRRGIRVETLTRLLKKELSPKALGYVGHMVHQMKAIATSRVLVLDTYCIVASMLPHHRKLKTIQIWHALSAVKKFGWQTVGMADGSSEKTANLMRMHHGYDYVACASDTTAEYFCEAFRVDRSQIVKLGLPRIDYILKEDPETMEKIRKTYPLLDNGSDGSDIIGDNGDTGSNSGDGKKNILYAPTFHKGQPVDVKGLAEAIDFSRYNLIVKLHPIDSASSEHVIEEGVIYDDHFDTYDMLKLADIVISDYSSLVVEASLTGKPLYLYTYDEDSYRQTTGLNMNFDEEAIGKYVFRHATDLAAAMEEEYDTEALNSFCRKYIDINTENCTGQMADFIESLL